jgi:hypothetical protein
MPVLSDGAVGPDEFLASGELAYSNSNPSSSSPVPTEIPWTRRFSGVVFAPMNTVASARAAVAPPNSSTTPSAATLRNFNVFLTRL